MHADAFLQEAAGIAAEIDRAQVERLATALAELRERGGRLFLIGLGGSAANCTHAAADLRTLCEIDAYSLCDSFDEFSAFANDVSFDSAFWSMLSARNLSDKDAIFILSVGGATDSVSRPISNALWCAKYREARIYGIVGHNGGYTAEMGDVVIRIPSVNDKHVTPHTEAFQAVVWHCLVSHPLLQRKATKW